MRITSKGQVTVPKHIRDRLGIAPGDNVGFREEGQTVILESENRHGEENRGRRLVRHLQEMGRKAKRVPMTTEEVMELTRGPVHDIDFD
jgi:AbrB family looped-hinge helix DNA binding protein